MRTAIVRALAVAAVTGACLCLAGCPMQSTYPATITPVYVTTFGSGLWVYNGAAWTNYPFASASAVVVTGSGAGAVAYVGASSGGAVSRFIGASQTPTTSLAGANVYRLFSGSSIYAATNVGVSILNSDGLSWTNNTTAAPVNDVFSVGTYTLVASGTSLYEYNNGSLVGSTPADSDHREQHERHRYIRRLLRGYHRRHRQGCRNTIRRGWVLDGPAPPHRDRESDNRGPERQSLHGDFEWTVHQYERRQLSPPGAVSCVWVDGAGKIYAGVSAGGLRESSDGGSTWTSEPALAAQTVTSVVTTAPLYSF